MTTTPNATVDVRTIVPRERHPLIFSTFKQLSAGHWLELINDHDPKPLYYQFQAEMPGQFDWAYLQEGPDVWRVSIAKRAAATHSPCCGSCGG
ncbi:MAG: DUF2249 domain-containing protein [Burkholderiales bacterium]|nr:DUF2249 domain-containing protein [Burkholderiales bacterium]